MFFQIFSCIYEQYIHINTSNHYAYCCIVNIHFFFLFKPISWLSFSWSIYRANYIDMPLLFNWLLTDNQDFFFLMLLPTHGRTFFPITMWYLCIFSFIKRISRGKFLGQLASPFDRFTEFPSKKAGLIDIYKYVYSNKTTLGIIT